MSDITRDLLSDLTPEELEPRLELQIITDPLSAMAAESNTCCRDGGNCAINIADAIGCDNNCRDGGNCNIGSLAALPSRRVF